MRSSITGIVFSVMFASFVAACTGADRTIHLCTTDHGHDSDACAVCCQLTIGSTAVVEAAPAVFGYPDLVVYADVVPARAPDIRRLREPFIPRGPPDVDVHLS